jgi:hypothetical protein
MITTQVKLLQNSDLTQKQLFITSTTSRNCNLKFLYTLNVQPNKKRARIINKMLIPFSLNWRCNNDNDLEQTRK